MHTPEIQPNGKYNKEDEISTRVKSQVTNRSWNRDFKLIIGRKMIKLHFAPFISIFISGFKRGIKMEKSKCSGKFNLGSNSIYTASIKELIASSPSQSFTKSKIPPRNKQKTEQQNINNNRMHVPNYKAQHF